MLVDIIFIFYLFFVNDAYTNIATRIAALERSGFLNLKYATGYCSDQHINLPSTVLLFFAYCPGLSGGMTTGFIEHYTNYGNDSYRGYCVSASGSTNKKFNYFYIYP